MRRDGLVVGHDLAQTRGAQPDHRDGVRVGRVVLAAVAGVDRPDPGRELRGHVHDALAVGDQALGQVEPDTCRAFDRPDPVAHCRAFPRSCR
jgi:hypothetical protein